MRSTPQTARRIWQVGCVSYLNAKPLIYGLDQDPNLTLSLDVPARLIDGLSTGQFDLALLPIIDYQRLPDLRLIPSGQIGCDGHTLTVRIFSRVPVADITTLACDVDSHTSVALARIILSRGYGIHPKMVPIVHPQPAAPLPQAMLLIGDKVVCAEPQGYPHQLDLGQAWKELTGLPFVFAAWIARPGIDLGDLPDRLEQSKRAGLNHVDQIIHQHAIPRGWPADLARQYMTQYLQYNVGPRSVQAIELFHRYANEQGIIDHLYPLRME